MPNIVLNKTSLIEGDTLVFSMDVGSSLNNQVLFWKINPLSLTFNIFDLTFALNNTSSVAFRSFLPNIIGPLTIR